MATPFRLKRSAVADRRPTTTDLQLGELALNTHDGFLYAETTGVGSTVSLLTPWREQYGSPTSIYYNHRVGIGSTNPTVSLDVVGDTIFQSNLSVTGITTLGNIVMTNGVISGRLHIPDAGINITDDAAGFYEFQSGGHIQVGTAATNSLQIFHDATGGHSFISEVGDGDLCLVTNGTNLFLQKDATTGSAEDMIQCIANGEVSLFHDNVKRLATTNTGVDITDNLKVAGISTFINTVNINGVIEANSNLNVDGNLDVDGQTHLDDLAVAGISTFTGAIDANSTSNFGDDVTFQTANGLNIVVDKSDNALEIGKDVKIKLYENFQIYRDNNHAFIDHIGGSALKIRSDILRINDIANDHSMIHADRDSSVKLFFDNTKRFETTNTGVDITDNLNVSGISTFQDDIFVGVGATVGFGTTAYFRDNVKAVFGDDEDLSIYHDGEQSILSEQGTGGFRILTSTFRVRNPSDGSNYIAAAGGYVVLNHSGDERLKTTGYGVTVFGTTETQKLNVTGVSTFMGNVGIGTDDPEDVLHIQSGSPGIKFSDGNLDSFIKGDASDLKFIVGGTGRDFKFQSSVNEASEVVRITGDGLVGIGTKSPSVELEVVGNSNLKGNLIVSGITTTIGTFHIRPSSGALSPKISYVDSIADAMIWADNVEARFGGSSDFRIYHETPGDLNIIETHLDREIHIRELDGTNIAKFIPGGSVELYENGTKRLETTNSGVGISSNLTVSGVSTFSGNINANGNIVGDNATGITGIANVTGQGAATMAVQNVKYVGRGSDPHSTSFLHFSDQNVPAFGDGGNFTTLASLSGLNLVFDTNSNDNNGLVIGSGSTNTSLMTTHMVVSHVGNVGIGSTIPIGKLDVNGRSELDIVNIAETLNVTGISTLSGNCSFAGGNVTMNTSGSPSLNASGTSRFEIASMENALLDGSISHTGDTTTQIKFETSTIKLDTAGTTRLNINNSGAVVTGITTSTGVINSQTDIRINNVSVIETALNDAVAMAIALG